ncbi:hypothetical protein M758_UG128300 [Ceratodon purpureus]|nr:hypothetical protein M758_UG128300 [Ceratodon purpureus]
MSLRVMMTWLSFVSSDFLSPLFFHLRLLAQYFSPCTASLSFRRIFGPKKLTKS